ncbi:hypothetical protein KUCAC02_000603, partial [Chaenocephalus aceratus]
MGKRKDVSDFDKGQIVKARRLGQSISKTAALVGCSRSAVISSTYQKCSGNGKPVNRRQGHDLNPVEHLWDVLDKQVRSMEAPPRNLQDIKDLLNVLVPATTAHLQRSTGVHGSSVFLSVSIRSSLVSNVPALRPAEEYAFPTLTPEEEMDSDGDREDGWAKQASCFTFFVSSFSLALLWRLMLLFPLPVQQGEFKAHLDSDRALGSYWKVFAQITSKPL